ncbi:MAG: NTP transferase domain-containing protein [Candidatus Thermoplasmatota archaeon]|nr:NTP transferase domain-containing protein [Candidatus Thermoplasmatota archaeon]
MTTVLILAGGKSTRMKQDKSTMFGGVKRIRDECMKANITRIITLCGSNDRMQLFHGEVWPDPENCHGIFPVIKWAINQLDDDVLLIPCDAFNISEIGITDLISQENCVPADEFGNRQPLFARISNQTELVSTAASLTDLFERFPTHENKVISAEFNNFNLPADLTNLHQQ